MYLLAAVISQEHVIYLYADSDSNAFNGNSHGWFLGGVVEHVWQFVDGQNLVCFAVNKCATDMKRRKHVNAVLVLGCNTRRFVLALLGCFCILSLSLVWLEDL